MYNNFDQTTFIVYSFLTRSYHAITFGPITATCKPLNRRQQLLQNLMTWIISGLHYHHNTRHHLCNLRHHHTRRNYPATVYHPNQSPTALLHHLSHTKDKVIHKVWMTTCKALKIMEDETDDIARFFFGRRYNALFVFI
ncbi:unnamed protein product [Lactuca virosa]|uniref:Uncharacterized protein n=1 Tax=Lactuca virosa TaxID=75947 RepID=A0AAU9LHR9_9ASTR|nr:unnamed protein product [Lactuca virosa]